GPIRSGKLSSDRVVVETLSAATGRYQALLNSGDSGTKLLLNFGGGGSSTLSRAEITWLASWTMPLIKQPETFPPAFTANSYRAIPFSPVSRLLSRNMQLR